jgi:hypothetical protein
MVPVYLKIKIIVICLLGIRPSLPLTQLAVDRFAGVGLERLGRLDMRRAADLARDSCAGPTSLVLALIYLDR